MTDFPVIIFHNPRCGTSRNTLAMIEAAGYAPTVIDYVREGWTREQLESLLAAMQATPRDILRTKEAGARTRGLDAPGASDEAILAAMVEEPGLVQRPIVVTPKGVGMCRPSEQVFALLERRPDRFVKEDGEIV